MRNYLKDAQKKVDRSIHINGDECEITINGETRTLEVLMWRRYIHPFNANNPYALKPGECVKNKQPYFKNAEFVGVTTAQRTRRSSKIFKAKLWITWVPPLEGETAGSYEFYVNNPLSHNRVEPNPGKIIDWWENIPLERRAVRDKSK